jgi:hypothetical protein
MIPTTPIGRLEGKHVRGHPSIKCAGHVMASEHGDPRAKSNEERSLRICVLCRKDCFGRRKSGPLLRCGEVRSTGWPGIFSNRLSGSCQKPFLQGWHSGPNPGQHIHVDFCAPFLHAFLPRLGDAEPASQHRPDHHAYRCEDNARETTQFSHPQLTRCPASNISSLRREVKHHAALMIIKQTGPARGTLKIATYGGRAYNAILMDRLHKDPELPSVKLHRHRAEG